MELSVQEAAEHLRVSEATIRRRIRKGELQATKRPIPTGYEWRVIIPDQPGVTTAGQGVVTSDHLDQPSTPHTNAHDSTTDQSTVTHADQDIATPDQDVIISNAVPIAAFERILEDNRRLQADNVQLAGQVGFLQAKLQDAEEQIRLLTTEHEPEPPSGEPDTPMQHQEEVPTSERSSRGRLLRRFLRRLGIG